jgi:lipopolysaccharide export system permease protein
MLVPQALPLAILLSSLITFGNLGESSELTAIKAAGISLMQSFRSLIFITICIMLGSIYFQNVIGPKANMSFTQLLISMKQKSPELEIPEGVFYDGIPNTNLYVQKKDLRTGMLYGIMIYRMTGSYEDAAIILADSGMMQSTAEKKHLLLTLHSGEWFENMRSQELVSSASVPYRRETFSTKRIVLDFDSGFSLTDASDLRNNAQGKSWAQIMHDVDSMNVEADSLARANYATALRMYFHVLDTISKKDSIKAVKTAATKAINIDTLFNRLDNSRKQMAVSQAMSSVSGVTNDLEFKAMLSHDTEARIRMHRIEAIGKFTLALSCLIFFFIGAPLGAIIRKGGLGVPVIISVLVFIIFYIFDNTGYRMARLGAWPIWFGKGIATAVLTPVAIFFTYKANKDSVVFNMDAYRTLFTKLLGLRLKRHITGKEVIIEDPDYLKDATDLQRLSEEVTTYAHAHKLMLPPNIIKVFFKYEPDHEIERISEEMETVIEDLGNTKDKHIISMLNHYPVVSTKAHTRPFERRWMNIMAFILIPIGAFLYIRMWSFRLRLLRDLRTIKQTNANIVNRINETHINK